MDREVAQEEWYQRYYKRAGAHRNDLRLNRGVLFQTLAYESSIVRAIHDVVHEPTMAHVLDVGVGGGGDLYHLLRLSYDPLKIVGIEIQSVRLEQARKLYPQIRFVNGDATCMVFEDNTFDLVFESTMFATLPNNKDRKAIASEMIRVCKSDGYLLLVDWRTPKPNDPNYKALTLKEVRKLFLIGSATHLISIYKGALVPPVGRFLSAHAPSLYFLIAAFFPFLVGQVSYLLKKKNSHA